MSTLKLTTLSNQSGSASVPSETVINGTAKAWVNFNGTGTVAIRQAFNVSSITDNGTGDYTVNFTNAMPDANYAVSGSVLGSNGNWAYTIMTGYTTSVASGSVRFRTGYSNSESYFDVPVISIMVVR